MRFQFIFLSALLLLTSCLQPQRFTFGEISANHACLTILPLMDGQNQYSKNLEGKEDLLGEYLLLALGNAGFHSALGPKDVGHYYETAGQNLPNSFAQSDALRIGRLFGAQAVLYGSYFKIPLTNRSVPTTNPDYLISVDLYLLDLNDSTIAWMYSTRVYASKANYLAALAKLSNEISQSLLASGPNFSQPQQCWNKNKIVANLKNLQTPIVKAVPPPVPTTTTKPVAVKAAPLKGPAAKYAASIKKKSGLVLHELFQGRSTLLADDKKQIIQDLAKAMANYPTSSEFMIEGHVDETNKSSDDFWVSAQQVSKVREAILEIESSLDGRIEISSKGGGKPLLPNINQKSRERNRRIIISLTQK